ncbi:hypothetical protein ABT160_04505 [Streptomyces sp. NPDC001941]|uniref:hypothetical protein n=1 Tax=Streptomyces sp. NPDC001941 TaxID=3154659 RepID=UPI00331F2B7B
MSWIDGSVLDELKRENAVLREHEGIIQAALGPYIREMEGSAKEAQAHYEAGRADPELRARQDASFITNIGYRQMAQMFQNSAESARRAFEALLDMTCGKDEDDES